MVLKDIKAFVKCAKYLSDTLNVSNTTDHEFRKRFSETSLKNLKPTVREIVLHALFGKAMPPSKGPHLITPLEYKDQEEIWFYINGVGSDKFVTMLQASALEEILGKRFSVLYNPTNGIVADLAECVFERTFDRYAHITIELFEYVHEALLKGKPVKIVAYSQGGIITTNMLKLLAEKKASFENLEVYTFASASDEDVHVEGVYQEHFGNKEDFVSRIGLPFIDPPPKGPVYLRNSHGHILNRDFLEHFKTGLMCHGKSRLYSMYVKKDNA